MEELSNQVLENESWKIKILDEKLNRNLKFKNATHITETIVVIDYNELSPLLNNHPMLICKLNFNQNYQIANTSKENYFTFGISISFKLKIIRFLILRLNKTQT